MRNHNMRICGIPERSPVAGLIRLIDQEKTRPLRNAISVGCGNGGKEIELLKTRTVQEIVGYDLSPVRIARATELAAANGVSERASFRVGDAFADQGPYDLVVWAGALHHMPDVRAAVKWSRDILAPGGVFAISEYVGPTQFRLDDESLARVNRLRASLPPRLFQLANGRTIPVELTLEMLSEVCRKDPSEACDSGAILPAVREFFPDATIREAGGLFIFIGMGSLYGGLDMASPDDRALLETILMLDELCDSPPLLAAAVGKK